MTSGDATIQTGQLRLRETTLLGKRNPCLDNIIKLAEALNVSPSELFRPFDKRK
jgi:hypothetical protein